jgi:hypothetical protein
MAMARETRDMLGGFSANRMAMAEDFTARLKKDVAEIQLDAVNMVHGFADERLANGIELSRMLDGFHGTRMAMARETRDTLEDFTARLKKDVADMVHGFADERVARAIELTYMLDGFKKQRIPFQEDLAEAHGIWQSHMNHEHPGARPKLKTVHTATKATRKESKKPEQAADQNLKEKVLKVINNSPKGITLTKAGKKIGVEWRTLIRPAKELLEVGDVRKKDTYYFPT